MMSFYITIARVNKSYGEKLANVRERDLFSGQVAKSHKTTDSNDLVPRR